LPPPAYTRLFGVEPARVELADQLLHRDAPWVVALVGIGGIGKTALADATVRDLIPRFHFDGVVWLRHERATMSGQSLSPDHAFDSIVALLTSRLDLLPAAAPLEQRLAALRRRLKEQPHLVVVDNLEGEAVADYLLIRLLDLATPTKFLVTTRTRPPEQTAVRHFPLPELSLDDSAALLRHHAADIGNSTLAAASDDDVARIYAITGGNPLALKLVAGLLDWLPLPQLLGDLAKSRPGPIEELYRHIFWQTWQTLSPPARALLGAMPLVAESGGDTAYLQAISGLADGDFWSALQELRLRSLLEVRGALDEKRYGIHRLTQTFVRSEIVHWPADDG
jgi:hypothetical protein